MRPLAPPPSRERILVPANPGICARGSVMGVMQSSEINSRDTYPFSSPQDELGRHPHTHMRSHT